MGGLPFIILSCRAVIIVCMNLVKLESIQDLSALRAAARSSFLEGDATITRHEQELHYPQHKIGALLFELARPKRGRYGAQSEPLTAKPQWRC